jgi:hypothetical protein
MEIARCKKRRTRAQLGIRQRTIQSSPHISPSEQGGGRADWTTRWTIRRSPGYQLTLNKIRERYYWLQARNDVETWCRQCDVCAASRGPSTRNRGQMNQYNFGAPFERIAKEPRKQVCPDRYGLFHQVAGSLRPPQPGSLHKSRSSSYQHLPIRHTAGVTQGPGP